MLGTKTCPTCKTIWLETQVFKNGRTCPNCKKVREQKRNLKRRQARSKSINPITVEQLEKRYAEQQNHCAYCLTKDNNPFTERVAQVDHVKPITKNGLDQITNIVFACNECNRSKSNKLIKDWKPELPRTALALVARVKRFIKAGGK